MKRPIALAPIGLATFALLVSGCGGENGSPSKAEFVEQARAVCIEEKATLEDFNAWGEENSAPGASPAQVREGVFAGVQLPAIEAELAALRELEPPEDGAAELRAFLRAEQEAIDAAAAAEDERSREMMRRSFDMAAQLAKSYGIPDCGNPTSTLVGA